MDETYQQAFTTFLQHTNEKEVLRRVLVRIIRERRFSSLLDIGAGNGDLAIPLAQWVDEYVAIEKRPAYAQRLRQAGLVVYESSYPMPLQSMFDCVLLCHVLSLSQADWEPYIQSAWPHLRSGGELIIVTYRGESSDWTELMQAIGHEVLPQHQESYGLLLRYMVSLGDTFVDKIETAVKTQTFDEMFAALSFVAGDGKPERTQQFVANRSIIESLLNESYRTVEGYWFPFGHYLIRTRKL